ncbi:hypothetical protein ROJ8625_01791 [Roseivivax jejudonensis]|uniref:Uncharacterized protein n=1 Tax=Roseivivax jejudonensis TaxID=1529041 RepID=A0A1X6Z2M0_9RHOB|nr:hypothetical protein [Roseivivax jejudonensis]SLN38713.1 hypothetical protein ROJ8625_01791 [Roseivivax jejudonensis]
MSPLLQTSWPVASLFLAQKFVLPEAVLVLALLRVVFGRGLARVLALLAALLAAAITLTVFAPALGLAGTGLYRWAARSLTLGGGLGLPLTASALLVLSAIAPGVRARWIDVLHGLLILVLLGLWLAAQIA